MLARPHGVDDADVVGALALGWGFDAEVVEYAPVGFGSYHWIATDAGGDRRFVTVDEVNGDSPSELERAFDAALTLRRSGLEFVIAPLPANDGATVHRLDQRYSLAALPFVEGRAGSFGDPLSREAREEIVQVLVGLHTATDLVREIAPSVELALPGRAHIHDALGCLADHWTGGPLSEPARAWLAENATQVAGLLATFDHLAADVTAHRGAVVITHGEPHPGNLLHTSAGLALVDWDTTGLALPERDLWMIADDAGEVMGYEAATGHRPDRSALALYRLGWQLTDVAVYLELLRSPHERDADTEQSWLNLDASLRTAPAPCRFAS